MAELNRLKIPKEDILRMMGEKGGKTSIELVRKELGIPDSLLSSVLEELEKEDLISISDKDMELTNKGKERSNELLKKHIAIENYFRDVKGQQRAHRLAHILEHYISEEVMKNINELKKLRGKGKPLAELDFHEEGLMADILIEDDRLFERLVSMGIFLGKKIELLEKLPNGIIVKINGKKYILDRGIAKHIKVIEL